MSKPPSNPKSPKPKSPTGRGRPRAGSFRSAVTSIMSQMGSRILQNKFFEAVYNRNIPEINRCLNKGVNPNVKNEDYGVAPIHLLAERNDYILGYRLIQNKNFNLEVRTTQSWTPLHLACIFKCKKFVVLLLQQGANVNAEDKFSKTPLHFAVERQYYAIMLKLLKGGANVNAMDCFENTPLSLSILQVKNVLIAATLFQYGINFDVEEKRDLHIFFETILSCSTTADIDFVNLLLDNGIDINMKEKKTNRNCLHFVASTGFIDLAIFLVERGAEWNAVDIFQRTPAKAAKEHGNVVLADYLRKGYRPPKLLTALPLVNLWQTKAKEKSLQKEDWVDVKKELNEEQ